MAAMKDIVVFSNIVIFVLYSMVIYVISIELFSLGSVTFTTD